MSIQPSQMFEPLRRSRLRGLRALPSKIDRGKTFQGQNHSSFGFFALFLLGMYIQPIQIFETPPPRRSRLRGLLALLSNDRPSWKNLSKTKTLVHLASLHFSLACIFILFKCLCPPPGAPFSGGLLALP
jgi:hypothetical protein